MRLYLLLLVYYVSYFTIIIYNIIKNFDIMIQLYVIE